MLVHFLASEKAAELTSFNRSVVSATSLLMWEAIVDSDVVRKLGKGVDVGDDFGGQLAELCLCCDVHRHEDPGDRFAFLGGDLVIFVAETDLLEHEDHDDETEARAFGVIEHLGERFLEGGKLLGTGKLVEDAFEFGLRHFGIVPDFDDDVRTLDLHDHLDEETCLLLELEVMADVFEGIRLEGLHADLVVMVIVDVQFLFDEIDPLGIRFFCVGREFVDAVNEIILEAFLSEFSQKAGDHIRNVEFNFVRQGIRSDGERDSHPGRFLDFCNINGCLAFFLHDYQLYCTGIIFSSEIGVI